MNLSFEINKQCLKRIDKEKPVANSQDYLYATFKFSDDWKDTSKIANFWNAKHNQIVYEQRIDNNICLVPFEVLEEYGCFYMTLRGVNETEIITTNQIAIVLGNSGKDNGIAPKPSQPSMLLSAYSDFDFRNENDKIKLTMIDNAGVSKEMSVFQKGFDENKLNTKVDLPNLLNIGNVSNTTINGITYNIADGVITLNGTATANTTISIPTNLITLEKSNYIMKLFNNTINNNVLAGLNTTSGDYWNIALNSINASRSGLLEDITINKFSIIIPANNTLINMILKPMFVIGTVYPEKFISYNQSVATNMLLNGYYTKNEIDNYSTFNGNKTFTNNVVVQGDFTVQGTNTTINTQTVSTKDNIIELASGRSPTTPITSKVGLEVKNYDGTDKTGQLVFDNNGIAYVGDSDDLQPLTTRKNLTDGFIPKWDNTISSLVNGIALEDVATKTEEVNLDGAFTSRVTASDTTGTKFEIIDKSIAKVNKIAGRCITSPNLIQLEDKEETTINGLTYSIKNGVITRKGTATITATDFFNLKNSLLLNGTYNLATFNTKTNSSSFFTLRNANNVLANGSVINLSTQNNSGNITDTNFEATKIGIGYVSGETYNDIIKPMLVEGSIAPSVFEPYFSGIKYATPTTLTSTGDNLLNILDMSNSIKNGINYSVKNGAITLNGTSTSSTTIRFDCHANISNKIISVNLFYNFTGSTMNCFLNNGSDNNVWGNFSILFNFNHYSNGILSNYNLSNNNNITSFIVQIPANTTVNNVVIKPMVMNGNTAPTQYEFYTQQVLTLPNVALNGLSDTDFNLCDYIDYQNKKIVRNLGIYIFTGNENWIKHVSYQHVFYCSLDIGIQTVNSNQLANLLSDKYKTVKRDDLANPITLTENNGTIASNSNYITICDYAYDTLDTFKQGIAGKTIIYQKSVATTEDVEIIDDTYLAYDLGSEILDIDIPCLTEITYNADINAQVVENADNIAKLKMEIKELRDLIINSLNASYKNEE